MPTENSNLISKELFFEDRFGNIQKLGKIEELQQYESKTDEKDDAADAIRYAVDNQLNAKGYEGTATFTLTKEESIQMQKMLGVRRITRKRFIKLLMSCGIQRNDAQNLAKIIHYEYKRYSPILVQMVIEWIIKSVEKRNAQNEMSRDV